MLYLFNSNFICWLIVLGSLVSIYIFFFSFLSLLHALSTVFSFPDPGTSHCANMYPARSDDPPQLTLARDHISLLLQQWLKQ